MNHTFLVRGYLPIDELNRVCIRLHCCHQYFDEPTNNNPVTETKNVVMAQHNERVKAFKDSKKRDVPCCDSRGRDITKKPRLPQTFKHHIRVCHCHQFFCTTTFGVVPENEYPIQCIDPDTGERYPCPRGECMCPICKCNCSNAYKVRVTLSNFHSTIYFFNFMLTSLLSCFFLRT